MKKKKIKGLFSWILYVCRSSANQSSFLPSGLEQRKVIRAFPLVDQTEHSREVPFGIVASSLRSISVSAVLVPSANIHLR